MDVRILSYGSEKMKTPANMNKNLLLCYPYRNPCALSFIIPGRVHPGDTYMKLIQLLYFHSYQQLRVVLRSTTNW